MSEQTMIRVALEEIQELKKREFIIMEELYHFTLRLQDGEELKFQDASRNRDLVEEAIQLLKEQAGVLLYCKEKKFVSENLYGSNVKKIEKTINEHQETLVSINNYLREKGFN